MLAIKQQFSQISPESRWWAKALMATLCAQSQEQAPKAPRDPAWQQKYDEIVNRIHDERLDKEVAARITDGIITGILSENELDGWIEDAKRAVETYKSDPKNSYGRPRMKDTIQAKLKKFFTRRGLEWVPPNGGEVGTSSFKELPKPSKPRPVFRDMDGNIISQEEWEAGLA